MAMVYRDIRVRAVGIINRVVDRYSQYYTTLR
jgi:hypothetical protein